MRIVCLSIDFSDIVFFFFVKHKTAYEMRISDWSSDVCSSDLHPVRPTGDSTMTDQPVQKRFTGRHAAMILVAFFGVVIAVNIVMASFALSTFGGTVVDNSYVASQHYNQWLARADAQDRLGWDTTVGLDADRRVRIAIRKDGRPLTD